MQEEGANVFVARDCSNQRRHVCDNYLEQLSNSSRGSSERERTQYAVKINFERSFTGHHDREVEKHPLPAGAAAEAMERGGKCSCTQRRRAHPSRQRGV